MEERIMNLTLRPLPPAEHIYSYSLDPQPAVITGCIGYHQETVGAVLYDPCWTNCQEDLYTSDFQADLTAVLDALRGGILSSVESARAYCRSHPECATNFLRYAHVFRIDTAKYACGVSATARRQYLSASAT